MISRSYCFTLFVDSQLDKSEDYMNSNIIINDDVRYLIYQLEKCETSGRLHLQGYIEFKKPKTFNQMRDTVPRAHIEKRKGTREEARKYCMKQETRILCPYEYGNWNAGGQGSRTDIQKIIDMIKDGKNNLEIYDSFPKESSSKYKFIDRYRFELLKATDKPEPQVEYLMGESGSGKTKYVYDKHRKEDIYSFCADNNNSLWFDGYEGQKVLLIDDFYGDIKYSYLLKLLDRYQMRVPIKGGYTYLIPEHIYITSNINLIKQYPNVENKSALYRRIKKIVHITRLCNTIYTNISEIKDIKLNYKNE